MTSCSVGVNVSSPLQPEAHVCSRDRHTADEASALASGAKLQFL